MVRPAVPLIAVLAIFGALVTANDAWGQTELEVQQAQKLFYEGRDALSRNDYATACTKLGQSAALVPRPATLVNLAECETHEAKLVAAQNHLRQALGLLEPTDERAAALKQRLSAIEARVAHVSVSLGETAPRDATATLDGAPFGLGRQDVAIDPGRHAFVVTAPGHSAKTTDVTIAEAEHRSITLDAGPVEQTPPRPIGATGSKGGGRRTVGFVIGGIGIAGAVVVGITGGVLASRNSEIDSECPAKRCSQAGLDLISGSKPLLIINDVAWGVAALGIGVGAILILTDRSRTTTASVVPAPGGPHVAVTRTF